MSKAALVSRHFDAIIIGTGQAGVFACGFTAAGMAVAIIEATSLAAHV